MYRLLCVSLVIVFCASAALGATVSGVVMDHMSRKPLENALVVLQLHGNDDASITKVTDQDGRFFFENVKEGRYNIEAMLDGYYKNVLFDMDIVYERNYDISVRLLKCGKKGHGRQRQGKRDSEYCFMIGGIEVQSEEAEIIPEEAVTTRKISSGEIEHMQATNLGDVLSLIPGVEKNQNPGLAEASHVGIRSIATGSSSVSSIESFGSTVIVDGTNMASDANVSTKVYGSTGQQGIDLRSVPADNIKSVEVITGIPSVEHGNFSNGVILIKTKSGEIAPKLKAKLNPDTKSASFIHGVKIGETIFDYHLNYAYSERNLRKIGDEYQRLHSNVNFTRNFLNDKLETKLSGSYTKMLDDEEPTDVHQTKDYNRGYRAAGSLTMDYIQSENDEINSFFSFSLNRKKAYKAKWVAEPVIVDGDTMPGFVGSMSEIGKEWSFKGKLTKKKTYQLFVEHNILLGIEGDYNKNTGEGLQIDSLYGYYGLYSSKRSYSFSTFPDLETISLFAEDKMTGNMLGKKYNFSLGLRYDSFNPNSLNLMNAKQGDFLCARTNFQYFINKDFRFRMGAGRSAKAVSLGYIYEPPVYWEHQVDGVWIEEEQIVYNPNLKTYTTDKYEASVDWKPVDFVGFSLTGYYMNSDDRPTGQSYPWGYEENNDTLTSKSYSINENLGWNKSSGVEFTLRTKRLKGLQYRMNVTYRYSKSGRHGLTYDAAPDTSWESIWYTPSESWREKVIVDYQLNYISKRLGVWVTVDMQHVPLEHSKKIYNSNSTEMYIDTDSDGELDELKTIYQGQSTSYWYDSLMYSTGGRFLFNFRMTKSLSQKTELSLYINNVLNDKGKWVSPWTGRISEYNADIYYGLEVSAQW